MRINACTFGGFVLVLLLAFLVIGSLGHALPRPAAGQLFLVVPRLAQESGSSSTSPTTDHDSSTLMQLVVIHSQPENQALGPMVPPQVLDLKRISSPPKSSPGHHHSNRTRSSRPPLAVVPAPAPRRHGHHHSRHPVPAPADAPVPVGYAPPPNNTQDCTPCGDGYTSSPVGAPCGCVIPVTAQLQLGVSLETLFPLVAELAKELANGLFLQTSQVRIVGANAVDQDHDMTDVSAEFIPLDTSFDNTTAELLASRFWNHQVMLNESLFGNYSIISVGYPGLPPSPPSQAPTGSSIPLVSNGGPSQRPIGLYFTKTGHNMSNVKIAVIALASVMGGAISLGVIWLVMLRRMIWGGSPASIELVADSTVNRSKFTGPASVLSGSLASSTSMSYVSIMPVYTGTAKIFPFSELDRATNKFRSGNIVGEGGFGRVYQGVLDDGTLMAVKVLTCDGQQGGREFVAEVEMLSRLHHRNLVKLIGICTEEVRCLVYELIPNGSVDSHLHGLDRCIEPLNWDSRVKIALGAARGLAYLHEDSNPRVIHRDFKASNILLENDFTPKVSDFGLAKVAAEGGNSQHISTRVMGTFGYVAPEYAMTGHLLVKSDVYSYGVVLLELLSGRQPVDMSQPQGQENLVTWARPLLTTKEGLKLLVDPDLEDNFPFDNFARVAAIASMCVQPEVSHRPFMGEVVQALKLVYNDSDCSESGPGEESPNPDRVGASNDPLTRFLPDSSFISTDCDSGSIRGGDVDGRPLSASAVLSGSGRFIRQLSGSLRRSSSSGPLNTSTGHKPPAWYRFKGLKAVTRSDHGAAIHDKHLGQRDYSTLWP